MSKIDPKPVRPPSNSPELSAFWDARDLEGELHRVFEVCHNCRMCVNYCQSFPDMFARIDRDIARGATGAERLDAADFAAITDHCWQCKLCYIKCPYTKDEGHEWLIDIPRALTREKAQRARRNGISVEDRALGEPQLLGQLGSGPLAGVANFVQRQKLVRTAMEKAAGIAREFPLPPFATHPFPRWMDHHVPLEGAGKAGTVAMFSTCLGDYNFPAVAANAVRVLEKNGYAVVRPHDQTCCGMPNVDGGDIDGAKAKATRNVTALIREVEQGHSIVVVQPTCGYVLKKEYPDLLGTVEAKRVAEKTFDLFEFLEGLRKAKSLVREFVHPLGRVAYHAPCHLRAQKIGYPAARVLGLVHDTSVETIAECSAVDGTWGMKARFYEEGRKYSRKLVQAIDAASARLVVSDCQLAGQRILQENGVAVLHPAEALAKAYGVEIALS